MDAIKVAVKGAKTVDFKALKQMQGKLKDLPEGNYQKLKRSLLEDGISEPITVWENRGKYYVVNGHQRLKAIMRMVYDEGFKCPRVPVSIMQAKNLKEAKRKLLSLASQYGVFTADGITEFLESSDIKLYELTEKFEFSGFDMDGFLDKIDPPKKEVKEEEKEEKVDASKASIKKFQLAFDEDSAAEFSLMLESLAQRYNTQNITDTIFTAVKQAYVRKTTLRKKENLDA